MFLRTAYQILDIARTPMDADQIVEKAMAEGILVSVGKTPGHTMRARLSEEIRQKGARSNFQRVGPNRFSLRKWGTSVEYHARPFEKGIPDEVVVCLPGTIQDEFGGGVLGYAPISQAFIDYLSDSKNLTYLDRSTAETTSKYKQLVAYVWLETEDGLVLSYRRGKYSSAHRTLLLGKKSVGFGGHVLRQDAEGLFGSTGAGLEQAALREVGEELKGILPRNVRPIGVIWDDSSYEGQKHVGVVMKGEMPSSTNLVLKSTELSINTVELHNKKEIWNSYQSLEFWSQLVLRELGDASDVRNRSSIVPDRRPAKLTHLALVGEIASGKTVVSAAVQKNLGFEVVSASSCLASILNFSLVDEKQRLQFQQQALEFISTPEGPKRLALAIHKQILARGSKPTIVDGLRQLATLAALKDLVPDLVIVYVDCPRDLAFQNYQTRWPDATVLNFAAVREHQVESDLPNFRFHANAVLHNADTLEKTTGLLVEWLEA